MLQLRGMNRIIHMQLHVIIIFLIIFASIENVDGSIRVTSFRRFHVTDESTSLLHKSYTCATELDCLIDSLTRENEMFLNTLAFIQCHCPGIRRSVIYPDRNESSWKMFNSGRGLGQNTQASVDTHAAIPNGNSWKPPAIGTSNAARQDVTSVPSSPTYTSKPTSQDVTSVPPSPTDTSKLARQNVTSVSSSPTYTNKPTSQDVTSVSSSPTYTSKPTSQDVTSVSPSPTCTVQDIPTTKDVLLIKDMDRKRVYMYSQPDHEYLGCQELKMKGRIITIEYCSADHQLKWMLINGKTCHYSDKRWHCDTKGGNMLVKCDGDIMIYMTNTALRIKVGKTPPVYVSRVYRPIHMIISQREKYLFYTMVNRRNHNKPNLYQVDYRNTKRKLPVALIKSDSYVSRIKLVYPKGEIGYICNPMPKVKLLKKTRFVPFSVGVFKDPCVDVAKFGKTLYILTARKVITKKYRSTQAYHDLPSSAGKIKRGGVQYVQKSSRGPHARGVPSKGNDKREKNQSLMVKDVRNKVVHVVKLPEGTATTKLHFLEDSTAVGAEFYPPSEEVHWITKHNIAATSLKQPKRHAKTIEDWKHGELLTVKHDVVERLTFYATNTGNIYKKTWRSTEDVTKIGSRLQVIHMALDVKHKHIYCTVEGRRSMYLKRLSYDAKGVETILRKDELLGLSVDPNGDYIYCCGPQPFRRATSGTPVPKTLHFNVIKGKCWDFVSDGHNAYILVTASDIQILVLNLRTYKKTQTLSVPEKIYSGQLQLISAAVDGASRTGRQHTHSIGASGHLLVMDPKNILVWKINMLDVNLKYEIRLPGYDLIKDIEYSVSERKLLWIRSYQIIKTPLKTPRESDLSITSWVKSEKLLRVKTDNTRIFFFTARNLYKAHIPFNRNSRVYHVTRVHLPTDAALDKTKENVFWIELSRGLYSVNRIPYSGGSSVAVSHFKTLTGFTIDSSRIMYLCSPNPAKLVMKSNSRPKYLWGQNKCSDITSDGDNVYILEPDATIVVGRANPHHNTNIRRYTVDSNIGRGFLKIID